MSAKIDPVTGHICTPTLKTTAPADVLAMTEKYEKYNPPRSSSAPVPVNLPFEVMDKIVSYLTDPSDVQMLGDVFPGYKRLLKEIMEQPKVKKARRGGEINLTVFRHRATFEDHV